MKLDSPFYFSPSTKHLAKLMMGMGLIVTILFSVVQAYLEYDRLEKEIDAQLLLIKQTHISSIVEGLWIEDEQRVQLLIDGIVNFENIVGITINKESKLLYSTGNIETYQLSKVSFALSKTYRNKIINLGELNIYIDRSKVSQKIESFIFHKLIFAALFVGFMVLLIMSAYRRSVGQPLSELTHFLEEIDLDEIKDNSFEFSNLSQNEKNNELLKVKSVIDSLFLRIGDSYQAVADQKFILDLHSIVAITDVQGTITYVNNLFCEISGYSEQELIGANHRLLNSNTHDTVFWKEMFQTITHGGVWHGEVCNKNANGELYWVDTTISSIFGDNGKPIKYIALRTDITERKQYEIELIASKEKAEAATHAKSEFLANMSHEIRTPMNGVIGMTNLLLDSKLGDDQHGKALTIRRSAESLLTIVNDILDYSKIEAGQLDIEDMEFDLRQLIGEFSSTMAFRAEEKGLEFICPATLLAHHWYLGDPTRIRQVLNNLVGNAIKFTEQGEVSVHIAMQVLPENKHQLTFQVKDTGIGVNPDQIDHLFKRFTQADGSTTRKYGGTGLGLAICKQLIDLMGGTIGASSIAGHGSTFKFCIELPVVSAPKPFDLNEHLSQSHVLVVDDNETNRVLLRELLNFWNVKHQLVEGGAQAIEAMHTAIANNRPFDLAILDMCMPEMDGAELGALIKNDPMLSKTRTMLLTSQGRRGDAQLMFKAGFAAYLSKPVDQSELYNALLQLIGLSDDQVEGVQDRLITRYTANERKQFDAKVLLVEDNATNQAVAKGVLDQFGVLTDIANNGREAIDMLNMSEYGLIFMDCQMPIMDGYEATRFIRHDKTQIKHKDLPIVAMTANAMKGDREKCLAAGMDGYIPKPISGKLVLNALEQWLPETAVITIDDIEDLRSSDNNVTTYQTKHSVFDYEALSRRMMNNEPAIEMVINIFLDDAILLERDLIEALNNNDNESLKTMLHRIKGSAANVGGDLLSELTKRLEKLAKNNDFNGVKESQLEIELAFKQLADAMKTKIT